MTPQLALLLLTERYDRLAAEADRTLVTTAAYEPDAIAEALRLEGRRDGMTSARDMARNAARDLPPLTTADLVQADEDGHIAGYVIDDSYHCATGMYTRLTLTSIVLALIDADRALPVAPGHTYASCHVHGAVAHCPPSIDPTTAHHRLITKGLAQ